MKLEFPLVRRRLLPIGTEVNLSSYQACVQNTAKKAWARKQFHDDTGFDLNLILDDVLKQRCPDTKQGEEILAAYCDWIIASIQQAN